MSSCESVLIEEKSRIVILSVVAEEVKIESCFKRHRWVKPFSYKHSFRIFLAEPWHEVLLPELYGLRLVEVVLHKTGSHIDSESVNSKIHPESHDMFEFTTHGHRAWGINRLRATFNEAEEDLVHGLLFPMHFYHSRWSELTAEDLTYAWRDKPLVSDSGYLMQTEIMPENFDSAEALWALICRLDED